MTVEERRRAELLGQLESTLGPQAAHALEELLPSPADDVVRRRDVEPLVERLDGVDRRLDGIDGRLDGIDVRLDGIDVRLDGIDVRLDGIDGRLDGIDRRLDAMDERFAVVDRRFAQVDHRFDLMAQQLEGMEHRLTAGFERRMSEAIITQTRTLVFSQLGLVLALAAILFGLR